MPFLELVKEAAPICFGEFERGEVLKRAVVEMMAGRQPVLEALRLRAGD